MKNANIILTILNSPKNLTIKSTPLSIEENRTDIILDICTNSYPEIFQYNITTKTHIIARKILVNGPEIATINSHQTGFL